MNRKVYVKFIWTKLSGSEDIQEHFYMSGVCGK